jgi:hypothetical protein
VNGGYVYVRSQFLQSLAHQLGADGFNPPDARGRLDGQGRDAGHPVALVCGNRLDIGGNSRPAGGVEASDGQDNGRRRGHKRNLSQTRFVAKWVRESILSLSSPGQALAGCFASRSIWGKGIGSERRKETAVSTDDFSVAYALLVSLLTSPFCPLTFYPSTLVVFLSLYLFIHKLFSGMIARLALTDYIQRSNPELCPKRLKTIAEQLLHSYPFGGYLLICQHLSTCEYRDIGSNSQDIQ